LRELMIKGERLLRSLFAQAKNFFGFSEEGNARLIPNPAPAPPSLREVGGRREEYSGGC
jgi:hypothetical protein